MRFLLTALVAALLASCATTGSVNTALPTRPDSAMYVVRLGVDTSYVQWLVRDGRNVRMHVVERMPRVRVVRTTLTQNPDGSIARLHHRAYLPAAADTSPIEVTDVEIIGDSTIMSTRSAAGVRRSASPGSGHVIVGPLLMWSYPVVAPFAPARVGDSVVSLQLSPTLGDRRLVIRRVTADTVTLSTNLMGLIRIHVGRDGWSNGFESIGSSINMSGARAAWVAPERMIATLAAAERAAGVPGSPSPRDTARASLGGASLLVDYSRPSKRGRTVFGGIVPWGRVWRTGANRATHFSTDRPLMIGDTNLPAGRYTLFTLPDQQRWTLIVSRQTDHWGTDYDPSYDVARIPMEVVRLSGEPVERFTIMMDGDGGAGVLRMQWDTLEARVPLRVR